MKEAWGGCFALLKPLFILKPRTSAYQSGGHTTTGIVQLQEVHPRGQLYLKGKRAIGYLDRLCMFQLAIDVQQCQLVQAMRYMIRLKLKMAAYSRVWVYL